MRMLLLASLVALAACNGKTEVEHTGETAEPDTGSEPAQGYPSTFQSGKFRVASLVLLAEDEGYDYDDDGVPDNNLPAALRPVDILISDIDMSKQGFNATIADAIAQNLLNILMYARHEDRMLEVDVLGGRTDNGFLEVDPVTLDGNGEPESTFQGNFESETEYLAGPDNVVIPITFFENQDPVLARARRARIWGDLDDNAIDGFITGVVPARSLIDDVIEPTIPEAGFDTNGDGEPDISKAAIMETVEGLADNENIADIELEDGERGVSAAFQFVAFQTDFPTPWEQ
ncbi:MAG: hypothetical protein EP330_05665 [Deltaproteobacteria bacterium]|nr:MAG: hypothetical protein EP330_05665 [Deltaproteobacteria bacterium]